MEAVTKPRPARVAGEHTNSSARGTSVSRTSLLTSKQRDPRRVSDVLGAGGLALCCERRHDGGV